MVDPLSSAAAAATDFKSLLKLFPEEKGHPKFGYEVNPERESRCPYIDVFMASVGRTTATTHLRRGRFKPTDTPLYARDAFAKDRGHHVTQEEIADENNFILSKDILNMPMSSMSNHCRLNLNFVYSSYLGSTTKVVKDEITGVSQTLADKATNTPISWWRSWTSSSSSTDASSKDD